MSLSVSSSSSTGTLFGEDTSSPFHLPSGDNPGLVLVAQPSTEENYNTWSRSVIVALNAKNKVGFIDGFICIFIFLDRYSIWRKHFRVLFTCQVVIIPSLSWLLNL